MSKFFAFYMVASLILFASLTGIFTATNVHTYFMEEAEEKTSDAVDTPIDDRPAPFTIEEFQAAYPTVNKIVYAPPLLRGYLYQTNNPVVIYESTDFEEARQETLPAGGVFDLTSSRGYQGVWTHTILVSDGQRTYEMFMKHADLGLHDFYGPRPDIATVQRLTEQHMRANNEMARRRDEAEAQYVAAVARYWEADALRNPESEFRAFIGKTQSRVAQLDGSGMTFSVILAGIITLLMAFFLGSFSWLRGTRVWESDFYIDDLEQAEEPDTDEEPPREEETDDDAQY
ncbi:MAG: hypothetical protein VCD00_11325 [Candidatus Hydrogenedentota bacterium]